MVEVDYDSEEEATYFHAKDQVEKWGQHDNPFDLQQVEMWREVMAANAWVLPG